jgi:hypothetical protein
VIGANWFCQRIRKILPKGYLPFLVGFLCAIIAVIVHIFERFDTIDVAFGLVIKKNHKKIAKKIIIHNKKCRSFVKATTMNKKNRKIFKNFFFNATF